MQKLNFIEFNKICKFLHKCEIYSLSCVNRRFYIWVKKYKLIDHKCATLQTMEQKIKFGCIGNVIETFDVEKLFIDYIKAGKVQTWSKLVRKLGDYGNINESFICAAKYGHIYICKILMKYAGVDLTYNYYLALRKAVKYRHYEIIDLIHGKIRQNNDIPYETLLFTSAVKSGDTQLCEWVLMHANTGFFEITPRAFTLAVKYGHISIVKWIIKITNSNVSSKMIRKAICYGQFGIMQYLINNYHKQTIPLNNLNLIKLSENGCVEMLRFLVEYKLIVVKKPEILFREAARCGHVDYCKYLFTKYKMDIRHCYEIIKDGPSYFSDTISYIASRGYLDFIKWLYTVSPSFQILCKYEIEYYEHACFCGKLRTAKWFYSKLEVDDKNLDKCIKDAVLNHQVDVYKWLLSLGAAIPKKLMDKFPLYILSLK